MGAKNSLLRILTHLNTLTFSGLQILFFALLPYFSENSEMALSTWIFSFSIGSFLFLCSSPFWSHKSEQWGRLNVISLGVFGLAASTALLLGTLFFPHWAFSLLWSSRILYGLTASSIVPVSQALLIEISDSAVPLKVLLSNSISLNLGRIVGPAYLLLATLLKMHLLLLLAGCWVAVLTFLNVAFCFSKIRTPSPISLSFEESSWLREALSMKALLLLALMFTVFVGVLNVSLARVIQNHLDLSTFEASQLMAQMLLVSAVLAVSCQLAAKKVFTTPWQGPLILGALGLFLGSLTLIFSLTLNLFWLSVLLIALGLAFLPASYLSLATQGATLKGVLGYRTGTFAMVNTLGYALGSLLAGLSFKLNFLSIPFLLVLLSLFVALCVLVLYRRRFLEIAHA